MEPGSVPYPSAPIIEEKRWRLSLAIDALQSERDALKSQLRELEAKQRKIESELKLVRQEELRTKREIEALSTLIEIAETKAGEAKPDA